MALKIVNNKLEGARFYPAPSETTGGRIEASLIVIHTTFGHLTPGATVEYMRSQEAIDRKVSAHFFVGYSGVIVQMVETDVKAFHAGESTWGGRRYCNGYSIGIEIENPGNLTEPDEHGNCFHMDDKRRRVPYNVERYGIKKVDGKWWMPFSDAQVRAVRDLCIALREEQPSIKEIVGHFHISPGRKIDPGPLCPFDYFREATFGTTEVVAPVASQDIKDYQARLAELGYQVGVPDGFGGPRTRKEVRYFQEQNALPITGEFDTATVEVLMSDNAKSAIVGSRDEWTKKDLKDQGSTQVKAGDSVRYAGLATKAVGTGVLLAEVADKVTSVEPEKVLDVAERGVNIASRLHFDLSTFGKILSSPFFLGSMFIILFGGLIFWLGMNIIEARLTAARNGQDASKSGKE